MLIGIDSENLFSRFYGVPLATLDDIYSLSTVDDIEIKMWMSENESSAISLFQDAIYTSAHIAETQFEEVCSLKEISVENSRPRNRVMWLQQFFRVYKSFEPDVLYLTQFPAIKFPRARTILRVHDPFGTHKKAIRELLKNDKWKHKVARCLRTYAFTIGMRKNTIVANSAFTARQFSKIYDIPIGEIEVIPYGFKTYEFQTILKFRRLITPLDSYYLMICGMRGNKRPDIVINEWAKYAYRLPKLVIIGKVPEEFLSLMSLTLLKSGNLVLLDFVDELLLLDYKINANAMIFASEYEGFGRPVIEALICGVPSIANDLEVFHEIGSDQIDIFSLDSPNSLLPLFEKYIQRVSVDDSKGLVAFSQRYSYSEIGKMWKVLLEFNSENPGQRLSS